MENRIENHSAEISAEEKIRIFDLACEKYIEGREAGAGEWSKGKTWNSPQEYMGYAVYKSLIDSGAIVLAVATQQKNKRLTRITASARERYRSHHYIL